MNGNLFTLTTVVKLWERLRLLTEECSDEERREWNVDDRWDHVDEPVWQEWSDAQEHNVVEQVLTMSLYLQPHNTVHFTF